MTPRVIARAAADQFDSILHGKRQTWNTDHVTRDDVVEVDAGRGKDSLIRESADAMTVPPSTEKAKLTIVMTTDGVLKQVHARAGKSP